ncbi:uncharacterized protein [Parasteatoda tepidariorum]|uniref:uncharacterized protein n=1 Tax=Parasteatoda tepidariorum TaxID=114398 RepID=UPI00077FCF1F|nr:uncharacterized protein LOC107455101 isoform X2 [Parasteatoda tepidariorum]
MTAMLNRLSLTSVLLGLILLMLQESGCQSYQVMGSYPLSATYEDRQIFRRDHQKKEEENSLAYPKMASDFFGSNSDESSDRNRYHEDNDSSISSDEVLEIPLGHSSQVVKRRKGPTLSVVNPLEILRQRLMLDLARRRIHENQQQIVANAQMLESIGKRSVRRSDEFANLGSDKNYQP